VLFGRTDRLVLEPLSHRHAVGLVAALGHPEVHRYLSAPDVTTVEALHARIDHLGCAPAGEVWINFAIRRADDAAIVGRLEATSYGDWAEIAYLVGPAYQRRGYAAEATRWLIAQLAAAGVREVWAAVHPANVASRAVLARCGFERRAAMLRALGSHDAGDAVFVRIDEPADR
jgi:RimJ/RimL family protein N-acetyltransferase